MCKRVVEHAAAVNTATEELMEEEEGKKEGSFTEDLVPAAEQVHKLQVTLPVAPIFWALCPSKEATGHRPDTSERAWGKAYAIQVGPEPPPLLMERWCTSSRRKKRSWQKRLPKVRMQPP